MTKTYMTGIPGVITATEAARRAAESVAVLDVIIARTEQIDLHGRTLEHDLQHPPMELIMAAYAFATAALNHGTRRGDAEARIIWPWTDGFKPKADVRGNLVEAGALILAAIDRLDNSPADAPIGEQVAA